MDIGRPPENDLRTIMDAICYIDGTGIPWRYLPHEHPPWQTVCGYFRAWRDDDAFNLLTGLLHRLVRAREGRAAESSAGIIDAQSIKTSGNVPATDLGIDAAKKIVWLWPWETETFVCWFV
ncbi:transposase [Actinomadura napierensis]|uniref:Insertion element IS402-like domain-containing protein n=1 Tax=Actinomadura napierensis TaxID=267854 RepID=A0ABP5K5D1_9ACTN